MLSNNWIKTQNHSKTLHNRLKGITENSSPCRCYFIIEPQRNMVEKFLTQWNISSKKVQCNRCYDGMPSNLRVMLFLYHLVLRGWTSLLVESVINEILHTPSNKWVFYKTILNIAHKNICSKQYCMILKYK